MDHIVRTSFGVVVLVGNRLKQLLHGSESDVGIPIGRTRATVDKSVDIIHKLFGRPLAELVVLKWFVLRVEVFLWYVIMIHLGIILVRNLTKIFLIISWWTYAMLCYLYVLYTHTCIIMCVFFFFIFICLFIACLQIRMLIYIIDLFMVPNVVNGHSFFLLCAWW